MKNVSRKIMFFILLFVTLLSCSKDPILYPSASSINYPEISLDSLTTVSKDTRDQFSHMRTGIGTTRLHNRGHITFTQMSTFTVAQSGDSNYKPKKDDYLNSGRSLWSRSFTGEGKIAMGQVIFDCEIELTLNHPSNIATGELTLSFPWGYAPAIYSIQNIRPVYQTNIFESESQVLELRGEIIQDGGWFNLGSIVSIYISNADQFFLNHVHSFKSQFRIKFGT